MANRITIDDARRAWEARDPAVVDLVVALAETPDPKPDGPVREGALTFDRVHAELRTVAFRRLPLDEQRIVRRDRYRALEVPDAEVPLPDRRRLFEVILALWEDGSPFARSCLLQIIERVKLTIGPWRALKRIFKEAEARGDLEVFAALTARFDMAYASGDHELSERTLAYMVRRAWRHLRRLGEMMAVAYPDAAVAVLAQYQEFPGYRGESRSWVYNHILYHEGSKYNRSRFSYGYNREGPLKQRAFADAWRRSPRPLFALLEQAKESGVLEYAAEALKTDFRAALREVEPAWVARLIAHRNEPVHDFVVWVLGNVPRFEQAAFRSLGLHEAVLRLFDSPSDDARKYAAGYARTHARDLPVDDLVRLADNESDDVRALAVDLLGERDPRKDVGLDAWGGLLESGYTQELAAKAIRTHFGPKELTPEWFRDRFFDLSWSGFEFVAELLPKIHPPVSLGAGYFVGLLDAFDRLDHEPQGAVAGVAVRNLDRLGPDALDADVLRMLLLRPESQDDAADWIDEGRLKASSVPLDFLKAMAYEPAWEGDPTVRAVRDRGVWWARDLRFDEAFADRVLGWLRDVRRFSPGELGLDWLLTLARRAEPRYHDFAVDVMIRGFVPADFAPGEPAAPVERPVAAAATIDLGGDSFLFTGKLATMQRKEAEAKVRDAGGAVASGVTAKLHYLVIGDEGSPLYGNGRKGSKQLKAEELNAEGANIRIISETAFLRMLKGETVAASADATASGLERLWEMAVAGGALDARLGRFARMYLKRHHPEIALDETDRPVDPGAEVPADFLTFERFEPLFAETREPLRNFALAVARYEFARWRPTAGALVRLAESPHADVRRFVAEALLADDAPEHRRYRIDPDALSPEAVYRFCESGDETTRALGLKLIDRSPRLRVPHELYRLTESPDRAVRAFVVRALWALYRDRHVTEGWKPYVAPQVSVGAGARKKAEARRAEVGTGPPPRPDQPPATATSLGELLRRMLFELPPGRPGRRTAAGEEEGDGFDRLRPLPNRLAKLAVVETVRDLAIEDESFARAALPPLSEFMVSRGKSEHAACLVAVTRIRHAHPALKGTGAAIADGSGAAS